MGDNNSTIQILRATKESIINDSQTVLAAGTPLYNKEDHYLYIADGTSKVNFLTPIVVKKMQVYEEPNLSMVEVEDGHYINIRNRTSKVNVDGNVAEDVESEINMKPNTGGGGELIIAFNKSTGDKKNSIYNELHLIGYQEDIDELIPKYNVSLNSSYSTDTNTYSSGMALLSTEGLIKLTGNPKVTLYAIRGNSSLYLELTAARLNLYRNGSKDGFLTIDNANNMNLTGDIQCNDIKLNDYSGQTGISLKDKMLGGIDQNTNDIVVKRANKLNKQGVSGPTSPTNEKALIFNLSSGSGIYNLTLLLLSSDDTITRVWNLGNFTCGIGDSADWSTAVVYDFTEDGKGVYYSHILISKLASESTEPNNTVSIKLESPSTAFFNNTDNKYKLLYTLIADMPL